MTWKPSHLSRLAGALTGLLCMHGAVAQQTDIEDVFEIGERRIQLAQEQQQEIDAIVEVTEDRFAEYQQLLTEIENLSVYNNLLQAQVDQQNRDLADLRTAIDQVSFIERQILPLMTRMITGLELFIENDVPFLLEERRARAANLRNLLQRSDVSAAEQFRLVMEAWQIEMSDYGQTSDAYTSEIVGPDGVRREVDLLRVGRLALVYVTRDGSQAGAWDHRERAWVSLDSEMAAEIRTGITAVETETPALFLVPVLPPVE